MRRFIIEEDLDKQKLIACNLILMQSLGYPNKNFIICTDTRESANNVFEYLRYLIKMSDNEVFVQRDVSAPYNELRFLSGSRIRGFGIGGRGRNRGVSMCGQDADHIFILNGESIDEKSITGSVLPLLSSSPETKIEVFLSKEPTEDSFFKRFDNWDVVRSI